MSIFSKLMKTPLGRLSSIPADYIDEIYLNDTANGWLSSLTRFVKLRLVYTFAFIPAVFIDMIIALPIASFFAFRSLFTSDETQDARLATQKKFATIFSKCLYALLATLPGLVNPKLVAFYFTSEKNNDQGVHAGGGYYHNENAQLSKPESVDDLAAIIKEANENGHQVIPVGAGRSQGKQFLPAENGKKSVVIDLSELNTVSIDSQSKTATVGAGAKWSDIQLQANNHKLALQVMQASNVFSVGGSIGTNIHGWDHYMGMLSNTIEEMQVVTPTGDIKTITPQDELFHQITGGLGLFGIVTQVKLKLTDNEVLKETGVKVDPKDYVKYFQDTVQKDDDTRMHLYRLSLDPNNLLGEGVAVNYKRVPEKPKPVKKDNLSMESHTGSRFNIVVVNIMRRIGWLRKLYWNYESGRVLANKEEPISRNEIMQPPINAMFNSSVSESEWLQEYFLPGDKLAGFLQALGQLLTDNQVVLLNASVRYVKENNNSPMSYAQNGDKFAVVLCFNQSLQPDQVIKAQKWLRKAQNMAVEKGGTFYLPYQHVTNPEDFAKSYPRAQESINAKQTVDPKHVMGSGFAAKYLSNTPEPVNHFKVIMRDKDTFNQFAGFLKVVLKRVDSDALYHLLKDIMEYKDTHEEIYRELCQRLPEITPGALSDIGNQLQSLSEIKHDLAEQAQTLLPSDLKEINGMVEIGYPGRFINGFKKKYHVTGNLVAMKETQPGLMDYMQSGIPTSYKQFELLDYANPSLKALPDNSAEVITCYVGLHHFPEEKVDSFLKDVARVLKPGGHFLLVDHDCDNELTLSMAHMAHSIFNAVNGISVEEELNETRHFHAMSYWQGKLKEAGLAGDIQGADVPMIREHDASRNRMVSFVKPSPQLQAIQKLGVPEQDTSSKSPVTSSPQPVHLSGLNLFASQVPSDPKSVEQVNTDQVTYQ
jgi:FAD/FMN-containing dehydrogenase